MSDPLSFPSTTPRHGLPPLLFAGQAQKEFFVNAAHMLADTLLHPCVEGERNAPPAAPSPGTSFLIGTAPSGDFAGHAGAIAAYSASGWTFCAPREGMRLFDCSTGQHLLFRNGWQRETAPILPTGGGVVDQQARDTIATLIASLRKLGVFPAG